MFVYFVKRIALPAFLGIGLIVLTAIGHQHIRAQDFPDHNGLQSDGEEVEQVNIPEPLVEVALQHASEHFGTAAGLTVVNSLIAQYPLLGETAYEFKIMNYFSGDLYGIMLNAEGVMLDPLQMGLREEEAYAARYGKLEPELATWLENGSIQEPLKVIIWLKEPSYEAPSLPASSDGTSVDSLDMDMGSYIAMADSHRSAFVATLAAPVIQRLNKLGFEVTGDEYAPALYATLTSEGIRAASEWAEIDRIYIARNVTPSLGIARPVIRAGALNGRGITGAGVQIAQIEAKGGLVATNNPYLTGVVQDSTYACDFYDNGSHATAIAGIIRSSHHRARGIAPGVTLRAAGSCTGTSPELFDRSTAAVNWGARALNLSFGYTQSNGVLNALDRFYDNLAINQRITVVAAAGNEACGNGGNVLSPGLGYNVITVGNFNDRNTTAWYDDIMGCSSSWRDPISTHIDREKPEVSAPGTNIVSTAVSYPWIRGIGSGTSFAAPMVTATTALMMQRNNDLMYQPEAVRAILMATAYHNIEGNRRLSERDGVGGILADRADDVVRGVNGNWGVQEYSCSTPSQLNITSMYLHAGVRTRIAIAWANDPAYSGYENQPSADLDLLIVNPSGTPAVRSLSFDNTYEIVDFIPGRTGYFTLRVVNYRCDYSPRRLGWAWIRV